MQPKTGDYHLVLFETTTIVIGFIVLAGFIHRIQDFTSNITASTIFSASLKRTFRVQKATIPNSHPRHTNSKPEELSDLHQGFGTT
jgi:hypothetical protein